MKLTVEEQRFKLNSPFTISRGTRDEACVLLVTVEQDGLTGYGECVPYRRYGETIDGVRERILSLKTPFDRERLQSLLPPGAARNGVDCALWDLESKVTDQRVWQIAKLEPPQSVVTAYTLSLETPDAMYQMAKQHADCPLLKVKLGGERGDDDRIKAVREGAPTSRLIVDANEGWTESDFTYLAPHLKDLNVEMVEQPLRAGCDLDLITKNCPIPVCADESCHGVDSLDTLPRGYSIINIKLDKTGGLTEALQLKAKARALGYRIMIGCMLGTSLSMAPALLLAQDADIVDLDAPLFLAEDRFAPLRFEGVTIAPADEGLWG